MGNTPLQQDWPAEANREPIVIPDQDDLPAWDRPPAPNASRPEARYSDPSPESEPEPYATRPEDLRRIGVARMESALRDADLALRESGSWAASIGYHGEVQSLMEAAGEALNRVQALIGVFEGR